MPDKNLTNYGTSSASPGQLLKDNDCNPSYGFKPQSKPTTPREGRKSESKWWDAELPQNVSGLEGQAGSHRTAW